MSGQDDAVEIRVDVDQLVLEDLEALEGTQGMKALLDVLDRAVVGGVRGRQIPIRELRTIARQIRNALTADLGN